MLSLKTTMVGKSTVGKTSIVIRLLFNHCDEKVAATIGASFMTYENNNVKYQIWDTAGQERFLSLTPMYFRDSRIVIFTFDVSDMSTLNAINTYIPFLADMENYLILIVGNKIDLLTDSELKDAMEKTKEMLRESAIYIYIFGYSFVSAKSGENFDTLKHKLLACSKMFDPNNQFVLSKSIRLDEPVEESQCRC